MVLIAEIRRNARLEREQGQEESYREVMDMIYGYVQYTEQNLSYTRFNGGFNKDEEDAIHHANYIANRITHFLHKSFAMYRVDIALSYLEEFIAKDCLINTSTDPHKILMKFKYYYLDGAVTVNDNGNFVDWNQKEE